MRNFQLPTVEIGKWHFQVSNIQYVVQNFNFVIKLDIENCQVEDFNLKELI